jgi:hypothetical protein
MLYKICNKIITFKHKKINNSIKSDIYYEIYILLSDKFIIFKLFKLFILFIIFTILFRYKFNILNFSKLFISYF